MNLSDLMFPHGVLPIVAEAQNRQQHRPPPGPRNRPPPPMFPSMGSFPMFSFSGPQHRPPPPLIPFMGQPQHIPPPRPMSTGRVNDMLDNMESSIGTPLVVQQVPSVSPSQEPLSLHTEIRLAEEKQLQSDDPTMPVNTQATMPRADQNRIDQEPVENYFTTEDGSYKKKIKILGGVLTVVGVSYIMYRCTRT